MKKLFRGQGVLSILYVILALTAVLYSLAFMTEYCDLFGLMLPQNEAISKFYDVILQVFNRQILAWALFSVFGAVMILLLQIHNRVPDRFALVVMVIILLVGIYGAFTTLTNLSAISAYYQGLDFEYLFLEGIEDYQVKLTTFNIGALIYVCQLVTNSAFAIDLIASHLCFVKGRKKGAI